MSDFGKDKNREEALTENNIQSPSSKFGYPLKTKQRERVYLNSNDGTNNLIKSKFPLKNILYIIITIILFLTTIFGCLFGILSNNDFQAINSSDITDDKYIGGKGEDLFLDSTTISKLVYEDLLAKMGGPLGSVTEDIKSKGYIIKINGLDWQVVYRSKDYVTLWLADVYKENNEVYFTYYFKSSYNLMVPIYSSMGTVDSVREKLNSNVFNGLFGSAANMANQIIATPHDLFASNITWQSNQTEIGPVGQAFPLPTYNLNSYGSSLGNSDLKETAAYDKLWLPSYPELFAEKNTYPGIWGLPKSELAASGNSWLRSKAKSSISNTGIKLMSDGTDETESPNYSVPIRPAFHLALANLTAKLGCMVDFTGEGFVATPSTHIVSKYNGSHTFVLKSTNKIIINSIVDQFGQNIIFNGSGNNVNYSYTTSVNYKTGEVTINLSNIKKDLVFTVSSIETLNIVNNNTTSVGDYLYFRVSTTSPDAKLYIHYKVDQIPKITILSEVLEIKYANGSGKKGSVSYEYNYNNLYLLLSLSNLPSSVCTITLDNLTAANNNISIRADNAGYEVNYDNNHNALVNINPNDGYYVNYFIINQKTYYVEYKEFVLSEIEGVEKFVYFASDKNNKLKFYLQNLTQNIMIDLRLSTVPPQALKDIGGVRIDGVAVKTTAGGDAKIIANTIGEEGSTQSTVTFVAWVYEGYSFIGWSTDGGATYLTDATGTKYGASAVIPADLVKGMVVTACFAQNSNGNINMDLGESGYL